MNKNFLDNQLSIMLIYRGTQNTPLTDLAINGISRNKFPASYNISFQRDEAVCIINS
jgi:hypothetical protein